HVETISRVVGFDGAGYRLADALEAPLPELSPVPLAAAVAAPSSTPEQPGELP
ncbi:P-type conjugative transfer ATPase TrbB, partial [Pseudomonas aeruginosa]|nr:P-type conjugative transfer ATPase TrbB [Pseudomonas aeruginosa]